MIDLGSTDFYFDIPSLPRGEIEAYSNQLFDTWESYIAQETSLDDYALTLRVEEGSLKGKGAIFACVAALYGAIASYGTFIQGLQTIRSQSVSCGEYLAEKARNLLGPNKVTPVVRKRTGALGKIEKLFVRVQQREITAEEAMAETEKILGGEAATSPEFMSQLSKSLREVLLCPQQLTFLPMEENFFDPASEKPDRKTSHRLPGPKPIIPSANQLRIEIWRESKRGKKKVRITER
ncbi:hypothetical protein Ga0100231_005010 [Opitutaceae bacterium TAV4]|nr:hypothetical protein Ga0100231_005010 [Opitutaceae bacterium TAV4]RRK02355.1 hypothetical protein Ga0100230_004155 [Opitutaceae bacterium TAV3]